MGELVAVLNYSIRQNGEDISPITLNPRLFQEVGDLSRAAIAIFS